MKSQNQPKFLLCVNYDAKIVLQNQQIKAFQQHNGECSECADKVLMSEASRKLLDSDSEIKPICGKCAGKHNAVLGKPQYAITPGQLQEVQNWLIKMKAANN